MMEHFLLHAHEEYLGDDADRIETYYCYNLQEFTPPKNKYDVVWMQWVACTYPTYRSTKLVRFYSISIWAHNCARFSKTLMLMKASLAITDI